MNDTELLRYSRQILLPQIDVSGQQRLGAATVLVVGLGGLGSAAALYLGGAGIGRLLLVDDDVVDLTNLQRQIIHDSHQLGHAKVDSARQRLRVMNAEAQIETFQQRLDCANVNPLVQRADVVIDCSDNFATRFVLNASCVEHQTPLVSGAAVGLQGQLSVFECGQPESPCYRCLYDETNEPENAQCSENGIIAPLAGIIGTMQALECVKTILNIGEPAYGKLLLYDGLHSQWRTLTLKRDPACPVCRDAR